MGERSVRGSQTEGSQGSCKAGEGGAEGPARIPRVQVLIQNVDWEMTIIIGDFMSNQPRHQLVDEVSLSFDPTMNRTVKNRKEDCLRLKHRCYHQYYDSMLLYRHARETL